MTALAVRPLLSAALVTLAFGGATLAGAPAAVAAPGDSGDIKVHHAGRSGQEARTGENNPVNNPSVCTFYFAAFNFDGLQSVNWAVTPQPPVDSVTTSGSITIDAAGHGISPDLTLADGRYKVEWTWEGQQGAEKSKIFRVDCDDSAGPPPTNGNGGAAANSGNGGTGNGSTADSGSGNGGTTNGSSSWNGGTGNATSGTSSWNGGTGNPTSGTGNATSGTGSWNGGTGNATSGTGNATSGTSSWNGGTGNGASPSSTSSPNGWSGGNGATKPPQGPVGAGGGGSADSTGTDSSVFGVGSAVAAALAGTVALILVRRSRRRTDGAA
ncbi:hypothetical protein ACFVZW_02050 [Streptomyces sp. NPDC059567]|uniref:hypothetical protein n=1 Tax=Streptomyces sp. NPDC059567 TaxID=3346867 RepID=UPI003688BC57